MCLMAANVGPGDAVFTTPFTFIATAEVVSLLGAIPVFVDIDPQTYNLDPIRLEIAIKSVIDNDSANYPLATSSSPCPLKPKAIIPVDLFGLPADYDPIMNLAKKYNLFVVEDAAQGLGGLYNGRAAGGLAHMGATSFFPAKPLGCYGDGGAIFTNDDTLADMARSIRVHGKGTDKYDNIRIGLNARLHTMQAAILLTKLGRFPQELASKQKVAAAYTELFTPHQPALTPPFVPEGTNSAWAQYSMLSENREAIMAGLKEKNIPAAVYYAKPLHLQPAYRHLGYQPGDMPVSEQISQQIFSLPMHGYLTAGEIKHIVTGVTMSL
jgi:UDP-2-acetamido-2-deoxy-ribo-hexuluronate aminotransferase